MLVLILLLVIVVLTFIHIYMENSSYGRLLNRIPGPKGYPIAGSIFALMKNSHEFFYVLRNFFDTYGGIYRYRTLHVTRIGIQDPDYYEILLSNTKNTHKGVAYNIFGSWLGNGLLVSSGDKWHQRRRLLTPAFHFGMLKNAFNTFNESTTNLIQELEKVANQEVEANPFIARCALHAICQIAMGINISLDNEDIRKYRNAVHGLAQCAVYRISRLMFYNNFIFDQFPVVKIQKELVRTLHNFTNKVIDERRQMIGDFETGDSDEAFGGKKRMCMIDILLSLEKKGMIDHDGVREECDNVIFAGHDTTTCTMRFFLLNIANHMDVQERLVEELKSVINSPDEEISMDMINKLSYMDWCFKESMRLYTPVPHLERQITENLKMKKYLIPKGANIGINIFDLHRNPEVYPDPMKYDPERFNLENCTKRHPYAFVPFSAGPRNCIGQKIGSYEVKSMMVAILRNFVVLPVTKPEEIKFIMDVVLTTVNPIKFIFKPREDRF